MKFTLLSQARHHPIGNVLFFAGAFGLLALSTILIFQHAFTYRGMQEALPTAARVPALEQRLRILGEQVELAELHAATRVGSTEEKLNVFVLPTEPNFERLFAFMELMTDVLKRDGLLESFAGIDVGEKKPFEGDLIAQSLHLEAVVSQAGMERLLQALDLPGLLTVGDALTKQEQDELFAKTEAENPAGIVALEQFLSTDLLSYAEDAKLYEERLRKSFSTEGLQSILETVSASKRLRAAVDLLQGPLGQALKNASLWPLQFLTVEGVEWRETDGIFGELSVDLLVFSRVKKGD